MSLHITPLCPFLRFWPWSCMVKRRRRKKMEFGSFDAALVFAWAVCKWLDESVEGNHQVICTLIFMDHIKATSRCIRRHFVGASYARFRHKPLKSVWMQNGGCCPVPLPPSAAASRVAAPHTRRWGCIRLLQTFRPCARYSELLGLD